MAPSVEAPGQRHQLVGNAVFGDGDPLWIVPMNVADPADLTGQGAKAIRGMIARRRRPLLHSGSHATRTHG